jgi:hypothetical protein
LLLLAAVSPGVALCCDGRSRIDQTTRIERCVILSLMNLYSMKTISFIFSILVLAAATNAQTDSWKIYQNKKLLLKGTEENEIKNVVKLKRSEWNKVGHLTIEYTEAFANKEWIRTIMIVDDKDSTLFEKSGITVLKLTNAKLKKLSKAKTKISIYTRAMPKDPAKAALVRIRKVHLCTLELE